MTAEEIAELRALTHRCKGALPPCECDLPALLGAMDLEDAPLPMLQRLLDEREALLEALTGLEHWITRNVSAEYVVGQPGVRIEALGAARRVLDKVCKP